MPPKLPPEAPDEPLPIIIPDIEEDTPSDPQKGPDEEIPPMPPSVPEQPWIDPPAMAGLAKEKLRPVRP